TVASLRARLDAQSVDVALDLEPGVVARADADKVRQLVLNLLENALDALAAVKGSRQIDVAVAGVNGHAALVVEDNGPGVPADALPRLFEPFFSLKPHGTGLGLAIAKRTVDAHGGRLAATPNQHGGLRIDVELPLAGAPARRRRRSWSPHFPAWRSWSPSSGRRSLRPRCRPSAPPAPPRPPLRP